MSTMRHSAYSLVTADRLDGLLRGRERAFLLGVMLRVAANARRKRRRHREEPREMELEPSSSPNPEQLLDVKQRRELLDRWLDALPDVLRAPFVLFELEGMTTSEIADLLELPAGTVKTRLRRARMMFFEAVGNVEGGRP